MRALRVSIIVPVYNGANYMRDAIDSALAQTWPNTEIIVVNDGSNDAGETDRIARSYGERIKYISKPNGGVASALNAGIEAMTGDVFCWLSHDDRHLPEKTARQVEHWESLGRPDAVLISDYRLINETGETITDVRLDHELLTKKPSYALLRGCIHGCSVFVPRALFDRVGNFDINLPTTQDYDLWFRSFRTFPFVHMADVLIESRWHDEQGSKKIDHTIEATRFWMRVINGITPAEKVKWEGSEAAFLVGMSKFLGENKLVEAASEAKRRVKTVIDGVLVSVVIPLFDRVDMAVSAIESVKEQTHRRIEIIVVDDGCKEDLSGVRAALAGHPNARLISQRNAGPAAARNNGWRAAKGDYVAFLDADDLFLPTKISEQLIAMAGAGAAFSHTSYARARHGDITLQESGSANAFPDIIGSCSVATPTVMVARSLIDEGFSFPEHIRIGEDVVLWLHIASAHGIMGISRALTIVRADDSSTAFDKSKQITGVENILADVCASDELYQHKEHVIQLKKLASRLRGEQEDT
ncbi:glycosyltransferase family 2 protein [Bosea sp. Tri-49]|uniref:glycosyltransferase family 2 protein n=2 Tax=Bosea TaxID=85413 RepID=UPI0019D2C068|nr:glycosyltransferase [Bosea sp. Tri-49]